MHRPLIPPLVVAACFLASSSFAQDDHKMTHKELAAYTARTDSKCALPMGEGVINTLNVKSARLNLSHEPIKALDWGEMTMDFPVARIVDLAAFYEGEKVHFMLAPEKDASWSIAMMCSLEIDDDAHLACMKTMSDEQARITAAADESCKSAEAGAHHGHH